MVSADLSDRTDFDNATRGLVSRLEPGVIRAADGRVVYDADVYTKATAGDCPDTVNPSLWRQSRLTAIQGLFEVTGSLRSPVDRPDVPGTVPARPPQLFDSLAIRIDGKRAWDATASIRWHFVDTGESYRTELSNGVLTHHPTSRTNDADLVITLTKPQLLACSAVRAPTASSSTATRRSSP